MVKLTNPLTHSAAARSIARGRAIAALAHKQYGVITREQLVAAGISSASVDWYLRSGRLRAIHRGVYFLGQGRLSQHGRWLAAVLAHGEDTVLSHEAAAALWGIASQRGPRIDVISTKGRQGQRATSAGRPQTRLHRMKLHPSEHGELQGIPVTSLARTLFDFSEIADTQRFERMWEEADRLNLLQLREVEAVCDRNPGRRALRPVRRLISLARAPATGRSPLEERFASFCWEHRLPPASTNVDVLGYEVDVLWSKQRLVVELDGFSFHRHRAAFERDRVRDARLQAAGYHAIRVTHRRLDREAAALLAELRALLEITARTKAKR